MEQTKYLLFLLLPLALVSGCIQGQAVVSLNPDGSGKISFEALVDPCGLLRAEVQQVSLDFTELIKNSLLKSEGIDAWSDVDWRTLANGKFYFKGKGYFRSIDNVIVFLGDLKVNLKAYYKTDNKQHILELKSLQLASNEMKGVQKQNSTQRYELFSADMKTMLNKLRLEIIFNLPAKTNKVEGFDEIDNRTVRYLIDGNRMRYLLEYIKEQGKYELAERCDYNRAKFLNNELLPMLMNNLEPPRVCFSVSKEKLFDYEKEKIDAQKESGSIWKRIESAEKEAALWKPEPNEAEILNTPAENEYSTNINTIFRSGFVLEFKGEYKKAAEIYSRIIADEKNAEKYLAQAYYRKGLCLFEMGQDEDAVKQFEFVIANFPSQRIPLAKSVKMLQEIQAGTAKRKSGNKPLDLPEIIGSSPELYVGDVDYELDKITIRFNEPMDTSNWFYSSFAPGILPQVTDKPFFDSSGRIWTLPVRLEPNEIYALAFNCGDAVKNPENIKAGFRSISGKMCKPFVLVFATTDEDNIPTEIGEDIIILSDEINTNSQAK